MKYVFEIGRHKELALAEIGNVLGFSSILNATDRYFLVDTDRNLDQKFLNRLGSVISIYSVEYVSASKLGMDFVEDFFVDLVNKDTKHLFLESNYLGFKDRLKCLTNCKKSLLKKDRRVKFKDKWTAAGIWSSGWRKGRVVAMKFLKFEGEFYALKLVGLQDINAYAEKDYKKPYRDAKLGMLPPKLVQMMLNIGLGRDFWNPENVVVMDPFCGTGTVLMEAGSIGCGIVGSDIQEVNIDGTLENLKWFLGEDEYKVFARDARALTVEDVKGVNLFVTEGYLGDPKRGKEWREELEVELGEIRDLLLVFLENLTVLKSKEKFTVVMNVPVYHSKSGPKGDRKPKDIFMKKMVENCEELGYSVSALIPSGKFKGVKASRSLLYSRPDQLVKRQVYKFEYIPG